jgi:hypothetical protein
MDKLIDLDPLEVRVLSLAADSTGFSIEEIGRLLDISPAAVCAIYERARLKRAGITVERPIVQPLRRQSPDMGGCQLELTFDGRRGAEGPPNITHPQRSTVHPLETGGFG